jgi:hypothetical protein
VRTLNDLDVAGKRVFVRVDYNVPLEGGRVAEATRIEATLPTVRWILEHGGKAILASHLGRPKGVVNPKYSLKPVAAHLATLLGRDVPLAPDCVGPETEAMVAGLGGGDLILLENLRFHAEEEKNDPGFAKALAAELICPGDSVNAKRAQEIGLVWDAVPSERLMEDATRLLTWARQSGDWKEQRKMAIIELEAPRVYERYRVSVEEYRRFREQGFLVIKGLVPSEDVQEMNQFMDDMLSGRKTIDGAQIMKARAASIMTDVEPELTLAVDSAFPNDFLMASLKALRVEFHAVDAGHTMVAVLFAQRPAVVSDIVNVPARDLNHGMVPRAGGDSTSTPVAPTTISIAPISSPSVRADRDRRVAGRARGRRERRVRTLCSRAEFAAAAATAMRTSPTLTSRVWP